METNAYVCCSLSVSRSEENMVTPFRNRASLTYDCCTSLAARWLVHSLAHELAASPEATSRLLSSAERCLARSDEGGELGKADDGNEGEAVVEALLPPL